MYKIIPFMITVVAALVLKILYDANTFSIIRYESILTNCTNIKDKGSVENIAIIRDGPERGTAFLPSSDLTHFLTDFTIDYHPTIYTLDLNKGDSDTLEEIEVVGLDLKELNVLHGVDCISVGERIYLFIVSHHPHHDLKTHGEYINRFEYKHRKLYFQESITSARWTSVNDVAAVGPRSFYVSLDHSTPRYQPLKQRVEEIFRMKRGSIEFFDGTANNSYPSEPIITFAADLLYPNGITLSNDQSKLYVGSPLVQAIHVFSSDAHSRNLTRHSQIAIDTFVDNVFVDEDNYLWIAGFPKLLHFILSVKNVINSPVMILRVNSSNQLERVHVSDGTDVSGMSIAARYKNKVITSSANQANVMICNLEVK